MVSSKIVADIQFEPNQQRHTSQVRPTLWIRLGKLGVAIVLVGVIQRFEVDIARDRSGGIELYPAWQGMQYMRKSDRTSSRVSVSTS